jgi:hypothetical protein
MKYVKMYQYAVKVVDSAQQAEVWMNERSDEGFRLEKIVLKRDADEIWIFMEREDEVQEEDYDDDED